MATPSEVIAARLTEASPLTSLVGQRSYPNKPTKDCELPYDVFNQSGGGDGLRLKEVAGTQQYEFRVDAYAETSAEADAVIAAVRARLHGWRDREAGVQGCFAQGDADERTDEDIQVSGQTFSLWFNPQ